LCCSLFLSNEKQNEYRRKTVQVTVDESIFKKFKNSFTSFDCVIKEVMQNARRTNATSVSFKTGGTYLKVIDNGEGFSSLQDFLSLSGAGCSGQVILDSK